MNEKQTIANPAPLGLLGFGMATILLNLENAGLISLSMVVVGMGFSVGGIAQMIAGIMEFRKGNTFGATAFIAYGCFWWSLVLIWCNPFSATFVSPDGKSMGVYLLLWGIFTLFMCIATLKHNKATKTVFFSLVLLFLLLSLAEFTGVHVITVIAGYVGIICGASAVYCGCAQAINEEFKRTVLPL